MESKAHLTHFMKTLHDTIAEENKQAKTYDSIEVSHFETPNNASKDIGQFVRKLTGKEVQWVDSWKINKG